MEPRQTAFDCGASALSRTPDACDHYPMNAEELARQLRVNAKSLRALLRLHDLVLGHVKHREYRIDRDTETAIWRHPDVQALLRH
jgi:hypothetical protein